MKNLAHWHRDMVEVAEVLNSMGGKNKCDNSMDKNKGDNSIDKNKNHVEHPVPLQGTAASSVVLGAEKLLNLKIYPDYRISLLRH